MSTDAQDSAAGRVCRRLRTKTYYLAGREHPNMLASSPNAQYWCALTTTVMGPDALPCRPESCRSHRACFEGD